MVKKITPSAWRRRFYPIPADQVVESKALAHSIRKWDGLAQFGNVAELDIDDSTCALCHHYAESFTYGCDGCPLYESRGKFRCDHAIGKERKAPYTAWEDDQNAKPMVIALEKAKQYAAQLKAKRV